MSFQWCGGPRGPSGEYRGRVGGDGGGREESSPTSSCQEVGLPGHRSQSWRLQLAQEDIRAEWSTISRLSRLLTCRGLGQAKREKVSFNISGPVFSLDLQRLLVSLLLEENYVGLCCTSLSQVDPIVVFIITQRRQDITRNNIP